MSSNIAPSGNLAILLKKIRILRRRLTSYGYSAYDVNEIILDNFLSVQCHVEWLDLENTTKLYKIKDALDLNTSEAEMAMRLMKFFGNEQAGEIPTLLLELLDDNSRLFGIDLNNSSSDSNDSQGFYLPATKKMDYSIRREKEKKKQLSISKRQRTSVQNEETPKKKLQIEEKKCIKRLIQREEVDEERPEKKQKKQ